MSTNSIFEKKWLDLVFEGKNKEYGAYKLRQENAKTSLKALLFGSFFLGTIVFCLSSFTPKKIITNVPIKPLDNTIVVVPFKKEPKKEQPKKQEAQRNKTIKVPKNAPFLVTKSLNATKDPNKKNTNSSENLDNATGSGKKTGGDDDKKTGEKDDKKTGDGGGKNEIINNSVLETQPSFPGGIQKFGEYIIKNFNNPNDDDDQTEKISIIISFIIEKDGSLTDIKIVKSSSKEFDNEAIRVLKLLKTKWNPGKMGSEPVRTQFIQPIIIGN